MRLYCIIAPGFGPYAAQFRARDKADARRQYVRFLGRARCPKNTAVWEA